MATDSHGPFSERPQLPGDVVADILSADRRRTVLACLSDHGGELAVTDLARCVCAREQGTTPGTVDATDRETLYDDLYDHHLPKLTETGVVTFDSLRDTVALTSETGTGAGDR